jgi:hypothetical protein
MIQETSTAWINGDLMSGYAIRDIYFPGVPKPENGVSSWESMVHPYYAKGKSMVLFIDYERMLTADGKAELRKFLLALVESDDTYVDVTGGFRTQLLSPKEMAQMAGIKLDSIFGPVVHGSEDFCYWAWKTLEAEGALDGAFIPPWFKPEIWIDAYDRFGGK